MGSKELRAKKSSTAELSSMTVYSLEERGQEILPGPHMTVLHRSLSKLLPSQLEPPLQLRVRVRVPPLQVRLQDDQEDHGVHVTVEISPEMKETKRKVQ